MKHVREKFLVCCLSCLCVLEFLWGVRLCVVVVGGCSGEGWMGGDAGGVFWEERGLGLCLWLKIPWFWHLLFQFSLQLLNNDIAIPLSHFGSCLILYDFLKFLSHGKWCASFGLLWLWCPIHCCLYFFCHFPIGPYALSLLLLPRYLGAPLCVCWMGTHCFGTVNISCLHEHLVDMYQ